MTSQDLSEKSGGSSSTDTPRRAFDNATLSERVYERLRDDILSNRCPPGTPLPEEALASEFNISRAPVREAIRRLAADGLVTAVPRQVAVVSSLSPQEFLDAYQVREALEVLAVRLAIPRLGAADLDRLDGLHVDMVQRANEHDVDAFFAANADFHALFVSRSENRELQEIYVPLIDRMRRYRLRSLSLRGGIQRSIAEHQKILGAVKRRDAEEAARLLSEHIRTPQRILASEGELEVVNYDNT